MTDFSNITIEEMNKNQTENLIRIMVKLQHEIENIHWTLNYRQENNQNVITRDIAEILNRCEGVLAESEYLWENRFKKRGV